MVTCNPASCSSFIGFHVPHDQILKSFHSFAATSRPFSFFNLQGNNGKPVVLIHGFGVSSFQYREQIKDLSLSNRVYALDLVGFGSSGKSLYYRVTW